MKKNSSPIIAGIDEAGRGPWAGPVVASCVILQKKFPSHIVKDSKQLSGKKRDELYKKIIQCCDYGIGVSDANDVDNMGIKKATEKAMNQAVNCLSKKPTELLVDGNDKFTFPIKHTSIIKGDEKIPAISAASIIAKVWRDKLMNLYHEAYPQYGFDCHKGYGTKKHQEALKKYKTCPIHRMSFKPVKAILS